MLREPMKKVDLEASAAKSLFLGTIVEENLFPYPAPADGQKLADFLRSVDSLLQVKREEFRYFDKIGDFPQTYVDSLRAAGLFGIGLPYEFGGQGFSQMGFLRVLEQIAEHDASTALMLATHAALGAASILHYGSDEQKSKYLRRLSAGQPICAFCLHEAGAGSDAASIRTSAVQNGDGSWTLNGEKSWVTNGGSAGLFIVFARTESPQGKISAFIVERGTPGVQIGPKHEKIGLCAASSVMLSFRDVRLSPDALLAGEGNGIRVAMSVLNYGQAALAAVSVGSMRECLMLASAHAAERRQFGKAIAEFGLIQEKIAAMAASLFAAESVLYSVANLIDRGVKDFSVETAIAKVVASEAHWDVANESLQIAGGAGLMRDRPFERILRDARALSIYCGTNEVLRLYIGLSGMKDVGEHAEDLKKSVGRIFYEPIKGLGMFSAYVTQKVGDLTSLGRDRIAAIHHALREDALIFEQYTSRLARATEAVLTHFGSDVVEEQLSLKRLADVALDLFSGLSLLSRISSMVQASSEDRCATELQIAKAFSFMAKRRMNYNLRRLITNEDEAARSISSAIVANRGFGWDVT